MHEPNLHRWPFGPGESPYRIKGTAYRAHIAYVERHVSGGLEAMIEALPDAAHRTFFREPFLAGGLYDIFPLALAGVTCAQLTGRSFHDFVAMRSAAQAPEDLGGIYRYLLRMVPTGSVAKRIPKLLSQVLGFGTTEILQDQPRHMRGALHGMPAELADWFSVVGRAYGTEALRLSGAPSPEIVVERPRAERLEGGVPLVSLVFDIRW